MMPYYAVGQRVCDLRILVKSDPRLLELFQISAVNNSSVDVTSPQGESFTIPQEFIVTEEEALFAF